MEKNDTDYLHTLNGHGVLGRNFTIDAPFLTDPLSNKPIDYIKSPIDIVNFKSFDACDPKDKEFISEQVSRLFMLSMESYVDYQQNYVHPKMLTAQNCNNPLLYGQYGLFAKAPLGQYQVIGFYSGVYATSHAQLEYMLTKYDFLTIGRYGNACHVDGMPAICGHYNGNYMSLINDWRPLKWYEQSSELLEKTKEERYNSNTIIAQSGDYFFIVNVTNKQIDADTEIITDYGVGYWQREEDVLLNGLQI